ncbi:hypothetical protein [Nesterenkonia sp. NBAIMH1]|uniref:hypothetical protein n=1 Tax=Nesterenkonia sp. NBAIMH1 TaxID=2600320 RepID=UPI0011B745CB|nr:hypothetical protein [Nesterenkonia sp. NBAIMH1]
MTQQPPPQESQVRRLFTLAVLFGLGALGMVLLNLTLDLGLSFAPVFLSLFAVIWTVIGLFAWRYERKQSDSPDH